MLTRGYVSSWWFRVELGDTFIDIGVSTPLHIQFSRGERLQSNIYCYTIVQTVFHYKDNSTHSQEIICDSNYPFSEKHKHIIRINSLVTVY